MFIAWVFETVSWVASQYPLKVSVQQGREHQVMLNKIQVKIESTHWATELRT